MVTMILVEDESFERRALIEHIDWNLIGVEVIGEAINGEQGLALVMERHPDIVLSDVSMPAMNGIEMARKIRAIAPQTRILFLSAYDDFDYAKQAIDLNIQAYVMKPVNESELLRAVKRTADEITERALENRWVSSIQSSYSESVRLARQALVNRILLNLPVSDGDLRKLDMEWLCLPSGRKSILLTCFPPQATQRVDAALPKLNQMCSKLSGRVFSVCLRVGKLATLCVWKREDQILQAEETVRDFFSKLGVKEPRLIRMDAADAEDTFGALYAAVPGAGAAKEGEMFQAGKTHKSRTQIVEEIERIIQERYHQQLSLESIAKEMHFTPNYVGTVFKTVKKISVNSYLMQVRMDKACQLLRESSDTVNDIAASCGFGSITYFHTCFKKKYGITPGEYRQNHTGAP